MSRKIRAAILPVAVVLLLGGLGRAQDSAPSVRESVAVSLVEVPVTVLDARGEPVRGLGISDFRVFDDGKEVHPTALDVTEFPPVVPAGSSPPPVRVNPEAMRRFVLLFDLTFITPAELARARATADRFVREQIGPQDLASVGSISAQRGSTFMPGFTRDQAEIGKALAALAVPSELPRPTITMEDVQDGKYAGFTPEEVDWLRRPGRAKDARRIETLLGVLEKLADVLKKVGGRKQILFFSQGFDVMTDDSAVLGPLNRAMDALRRSDCVVHAIDIAGLREGRQEVNAAWGNTPQEVLATMASETSGQFLENSNDFTAALGHVLDATRVVYVLTFPSRSSGHPGRYHRLEVKVARKGVRTFARPGYEEPN